MNKFNIQKLSFTKFYLIVSISGFIVLLGLPFISREADPFSVFTGGIENLPLRHLIIISPHWEGIRREFERAFSIWTSIKFGYRVKIDWLDVGGTSDAIRYVLSQFEKSPSGIGIDIFFGGGIDPYLKLEQMNLIEIVDIPADIIKQIPATLYGVPLYSSNHVWFGTCLSGFGIIFNKIALKKLNKREPVSWECLASPCYFDWIGAGDPRSSGSIHMVYEIILQAYGWERGWSIITGMGANVRNFSRSASEIPKDVATGEIICGMAIDVYAWRISSEAGYDRIGFILPENATVINPDCIAVLKGAPNREVAEKFIEFVLSSSGQILWSAVPSFTNGPVKFTLGRMPVIPDIISQLGEFSAVKLDPYKIKTTLKYNAKLGSKRWNVLNDLIGATILDTHGELKDTWKKLIDLPDSETKIQLLQKFSSPLISEEEILILADLWNDPLKRATKINEWIQKSLAKYAKLKEEITYKK